MSSHAPAPVPAAQVVEAEPATPVPAQPLPQPQPQVTNHYYYVAVHAPTYYVGSDAAAHSATPAPARPVSRPVPHSGSATNRPREIALGAAVAAPPAVAAMFLPVVLVALVVLGAAVLACAVGTVAIRRSGKRAAHTITHGHMPTQALTHLRKEMQPR